MDEPTTEYRRLPADDGTFSRYVRYAFRPSAGPWTDEDREELEERLARRTVEREVRGLFVPESEPKEEPVTVAAWHDFDLRVRGRAHRIGGVSAVATPPEHRRRGYVRTMLGEMLDELHEEGIAFSALWPFKRSFYRALGWETCSRYAELSGPPEQFRSAAAAPAGSFHRVTGEDWETLAPVLAAHDEGREFHMERTGAWWEHRVFSSWDGPDPYGTRWDDGSGTARGYLVYRVEDGDDRTLEVRDAAWTDPEAYGQLLRFLGDHDSQVARVKLYTSAAPTPPLLDLVEDPSELTVETKAGPMFRLVDVVAGLEALSYPRVEETIRFEVADPLRERNVGRFELRVSDGEATCTRVEGGVEWSIGVEHLSALVSGYRDAVALSDAGALDVGEGTTERLTALFPPVPTFLREFF
jgi:predicted acetyltransferase